jgi:hypothetical protein
VERNKETNIERIKRKCTWNQTLSSDRKTERDKLRKNIRKIFGYSE